MNSLEIATNCPCCGSSKLASSPAVLMPFLSERVFGWSPQYIDSSWGLKTINSGWAYSLCNSLQCSYCGHLFLDIRFGDGEMTRLYKNYRDNEYVESREKYEPGYGTRNEDLRKRYVYLEEIENFIKREVSEQETILDWGGSNGRNTPFRDQAKNVYVYDISEVDVKSSNNVQKLTADNVNKHTYDLVSCIHVLEHIPRLHEEMDRIRSIMTESTHLYIEVPCEEIFSKNICPQEIYQHKKHWHEHINFFTKRSLKELIRQSRLNLVDIRLYTVINKERKTDVWQLLAKR